MKRLTVDDLFTTYGVKFGDWPAMQAKMASEGFTILLSNIKSIRHDSKRDIYVAKFDMGTQAAEVRVSLDVAQFMLEQLLAHPFYWFVKMDKGVIVDAVAADLR